MGKAELLRKIYLTKKSRILLSEELKNKHDFYQGLIVYYTVVIIVFSLLEIGFGFSNSINIFIMSITLSFFTVSVQAQRYLERYYSIKQHYIELGTLHYELSNEDDEKIIVVINKKYSEMLDQVENHNEIHYLKVLKKDNQEWELIKDKKRISRAIFQHNALAIITKLILIIVPFLIPIGIKHLCYIEKLLT